MSKTIKIIDLLNKMAKHKTLPQRIKAFDKIFSLDDYDYWFSDKNNGTSCNLMELIRSYTLNKTVEIIEDKDEDEDINIQDINIQDIEEFKKDENNYIHTDIGAWKTRKMDIAFLNKINDLIKAVKKLDKEINKN